MTAYEKAEQMYIDRGHTADDLAEETIWHCLNGNVIAGPLEFALARPVDSSGGKVACDSLNDNGLTLNFDCWTIHVAVGEMKELLPLLPYSLPFIAFQRLSGYKIYPFNKFL